MERILIIDGLNTFIRNWTVVPSMNSNGEPNGGVVGFLRSLKVFIREMKPTKTVIVWDGKNGSQKRRDMYSGYKEGRKPKLNRQYEFETLEESINNMQHQYTKVRHLLDMVGVTQVEVDSVEADDVIAFLCNDIYTDDQKVVISSDKDFFQLVNNTTLVYSPTKKVYYSTEEVKNVYGVLPSNYIYTKALVGDGSDNIPGIKGIGEKSVIKLFPFLADKVSSSEEILKFAVDNANVNTKYKSIVANKETILKNIELMQLSSTIMSIQSVQAVKFALEKNQPQFMLTELKISFLRDGIQITDADFFPVFEQYKVRSLLRNERPV